MRSRLLAILLFALVGLVSWTPTLEGQAPPPPLSVALSDGTLVVEGATPGGRVVWFGLSISEADDGVIERAQYGNIADVGRDGTARIEERKPFAPSSLWLVVDFESGNKATFAPPGSAALLASFRGKGIHKGLRGHDTVEDLGHYAVLLVVRPKLGAWTGAVGDGGNRDEDGRADGRWSLSIADLAPISSSPSPPEDLEPGDTVALVGIYSFELVNVTVGKS